MELVEQHQTRHSRDEWTETPTTTDEWIFRLCVPSSAQSTSTSTTSTTSSSTSALLELKQVQPAKNVLLGDICSGNIKKKKKVLSNTANAKVLVEEKTSLLPSESDDDDDDDDEVDDEANTSSSLLLGWTFTSPYWSLRSENILTVTYFAAWQALPEYTSKSSSCSSCCASSAPIDYSAFTYTANDVVKVERILDFDAGRTGIFKKCQAIKLYLKPLDSSHVPPRPLHLDVAWERHVQQIQDGRSSRTPPPPPPAATPRTRNSKQQQSSSAAVDNDDDDDATRSSSSLSLLSACPIVTFCLPNNHVDPPLLWNVQFPTTSVVQEEEDEDEESTSLSRTVIAIETLTVLDGALLVSSSNTQQHSQQHSQQPYPTHIYINGYQSWSFAGSLPRGHQQPTSALPSMYSRAFNYGGSVPPPADIDYDNVEKSHQQLSPLQVQYTSDFFTCITSDGQVPVEKRRMIPFPRRSPQQRRNRNNRRRHHHGIDDDTLLDNNEDEDNNNDEQQHGTTVTAVTSSINLNSGIPYQQLIDETGGPALLLGWLSQRQQFGVVTADKELRQFQMHASCHGQILLQSDNNNDDNENDNYITTDWAYTQLLSPHSYDEEPMVHYLHAVAACNEARPLQNGSLLTGWCSWYFAYENISARLLSDNVRHLAALRTIVPTNVSVVDDGYMTAWGDWDSVKPRQFPNGMASVAQSIRDYNMRPGLWMAPFAADKHSMLAKQHPDWIIRNAAGVAANSSHCGKFFYGLDATNPSVREYVFECVRRAVRDWGFNVLKIDFLYAACLEGNGKYDLSLTRGQAMILALQTIRDAAGPDTYLIGCGCPIGSGIGFVDAMRVSADTGPTWYPSMPLPWWDMGTLPSLRSMVRNSVSRAPMGHRWWHNDPDCLMFGEHTRLTENEVASAASIVAMTCGMLLLSDDLPKVPATRMNILSKIFPMTGVSATVLDLHCTNTGMPGLLKLWCTDKYNVLDRLREQMSFESTTSSDTADHNAEATFLARQASFRHDDDGDVSAVADAPEERKRSCIHVTKGLGTWTVVSISNWLDKEQVVHIPAPALLPAPTTGWGTTSSNDGSSTFDRFKLESKSSRDFGQDGYHVFEFWSSRYSWLPAFEDDVHNSKSISKKLGPHATEIFHIKPVSPEAPQYIGSDLHFSCGRELLSFQRPSPNRLMLRLATDYRRAGSVFVFIPRVNTDNVRVTVRGEPARWITIGNTPRVNESGSPRLLGRVISIPLVVLADGTDKDGHISIQF